MTSGEFRAGSNDIRILQIELTVYAGIKIT